MLGPEEDAHVEPRGDERLRGGDEVERDGGGVAEEAEAPARMRGASRQKDVQAGLEAAHACESSGTSTAVSSFRMHRRRTYDSWALDGRPDRAPVVAAVLPRLPYGLLDPGRHREDPRFVPHVIVVDDASPDGVRAAVSALVGSARRSSHARNEPRRRRRDEDRIRHALELGADIVVKLDSDGQMDPALIPEFVAPLVEGRADFTKGNRFADLAVISAMPPLRRAGNLALSFLVKAASGYWSLFDPCNGYLAIASRLLRGDPPGPARGPLLLRDQPALRVLPRQRRRRRRRRCTLATATRSAR